MLVVKVRVFIIIVNVGQVHVFGTIRHEHDESYIESVYGMRLHPLRQHYKVEHL